MHQLSWRRPLVLALALFAAAPPPAYACHRFSRWYYPWPQRCSFSTAEMPRLIRVSMREIEPATPTPPAREIAPTDGDLRAAAIERLKTAPRPSTDDAARSEAIERLKTELAMMAVAGKLTVTNDFTVGMPDKCPENLILDCRTTEKSR